MSDQACEQAALAKFMGTEECIMYSYDMATINSVLPAFANAKDVIICDEVCSPQLSAGAGAQHIDCILGMHLHTACISAYMSPKFEPSICSWLMHSSGTLLIHRHCPFQP